MADLSDLLGSEAPVPMVVEHPATGDPLLGPDNEPMTIFVWGPDSAVSRKVEKDIAADMLERASRNRGGRFKLDADTSERYARRRFLARIDGWKGLTLAGAPFEYNDQNKQALFDDPKFGVLRRQVEGFTALDTNFLSAASNSTD